jgi:hypothetical protein
MSDRNELFPFPAQADESSDQLNQGDKAALPSFPQQSIDTEAPLSQDEIVELRKIMQLFRENNPEKLISTFSVENDEEVESIEPPPSQLFSAKTSPATQPDLSLKEEISKVLKLTSGTDELDKTICDDLVSVLFEIHDKKLLLNLFAAINSAFPMKFFLRNGTPEQKIFALAAVGDKFFHSISGLVFPQRKRLVKVIARYLSEISVSFSFIQMEGENFNPQYHERVPGSSSSSRIIKEMRGFLIVGKDNSQVIRISPVLT